MIKIKSKPVRTILGFMKPYSVCFVNLFLTILAASFVYLIYPYIFAFMIDRVFYKGDWNLFKTVVIAYTIIFIGEQAIQIILNMEWAYLVTKFIFDIRRKLFEKIFRIKASFLSNAQTGDLVARLNNDPPQVMELLHWHVLFTASNVIRLIITFVIVFFINMKLAVLMLVVIPASVYISLFFTNKIKNIYEQYRKDYGKYISWIYEMLQGMREIQLFAAERSVAKRFVSFSKKLVHARVRASNIEFVSQTANSLISLLSDLFLYIASAILISNKELSIAGFVATMEYFAMCNYLLRSINDSNFMRQNNKVSIKKVLDILEEETEDTRENLPQINITGGEIEFSKVSFYYEKGLPVLKNIDLHIKKGEKISLVGVSGAGKSTMVGLLQRFYEPQEGCIKIDGTDICQCDLKSLRRSIGIVNQESILFDGTIRENLKLGNRKCSEKEMWEACKKAYIDDFVRRLPDKLDTVIGSEGINISGGQKQRIAIARVFLKNPKIIVFDEATSALDFEAETAVKKAWQELSAGKTSIVIAHRLSTILDSDRVAVLHDGRIVSFDTHKKLLESCEHYNRLFRDQYLIEGCATA
ncbi:MAG TPA: ABC transporter ATP-binding protein [Ruminiclostridium sp.]|nr:ABC transporter ATP-binding protein [Ruminiclostridium sp.]